jgi:polyphosphate kinase 2 (PPK2 family)
LKLIEEYSEELGILQREAKDLDIPLIIVFEGWYDGFIGEVINRQLLPLDSRGFDFHFTDTPTAEENNLPFIFRFSRKIPPKGKIAVFDRSWYMRGLIEHLINESEKNGCAPSSYKTNLETVLTEPADEEVIHTARFTHLIKIINDFENTLYNNGTRFIKIYMGARKDKRIENHKVWKKIIPYDLDKRSAEKIYKKDVRVLKEMLEQTNATYAPWNLYFVNQNIDEATAVTMKIIIDQMKAIIFDAKSKQFSEPEQTDAETSIQTISMTAGPLDRVDLTKFYTKQKYKKKLKKYQKQLTLSHYLLHLNKKPMVLVFEGWDAAGKGGNIKRIVQSMNPRHYRVIPIASPTDTDKKYHYLWRFLDGIPPSGQTSLYDRSWYGRVMVERVEHFCTEEEWKRAYGEINRFERAMTSDGVIVLKFWLHISKEKQYERFTARSLNPLKQWKLTDEDWRNRGKWDEYYTAVNEMIEKTSTEKAPWIIVEADDKYYARIKILKTIIQRIKKELEEKDCLKQNK